MGVSMESKSVAESRLPSVVEGEQAELPRNASPRRGLGRSLLMRRRANSQQHSGKSNDDNSDSSPSKRQRRPALRRFTSRRKAKEQQHIQSVPIQARSDPVVNESLAQSMPMDASASSMRTRRRMSLSFLRRENGGSPSSKIALQRDTSRSKESRCSSKGSVTEDSDFEGHNLSLIERTKIITEQVISPANSSQLSADADDQPQSTEDINISHYNCATAIFLERICGIQGASSFEDIHSRHPQELPEDPTVQESIECIFASQLEGGLGVWDDEEDDVILNQLEPRDQNRSPSAMVSPSLIQQSRQNRSDRLATSMSQSKKRYEQASLVYVGTFDPTIQDDQTAADRSEGRSLPCPCAQSRVPALDPSEWPQAPLLLRPTPGRGTRIKGVRLGNSKDYLWEPASHLSWSECLAKKWGVSCKSTPRVGCCERCAILPINNGNELEGESLIIDFESELFEGSLLLRLRFSNGTTLEPYDDNQGYFKGMNRRYQAVVRGRFKKAIPLTELSTGFQFERPCGKLPAKWILRGAIKVLSFFAPQLDAKLEGNSPHSMSPLGSTPQSINVDHVEGSSAVSMENLHEEPTDRERTLLGEASSSGPSLQRARARKKAFDKLVVKKSKEPKTDPSKIYTFEFLQHLLNFQDFSIELGSMLGSVHLENILDGQPLQIMASQSNNNPIWSFDVWHKSLWDRAKYHDDRVYPQTAAQ